MITQEQQNQITDYCQQCGIKYYDVELEVLDHIMEWIENDMAAHRVPFEVSFLQMQREFTRRDCRAIVRSRSSGIRGRMLRSCLRELAGYFSWPKIAIVFALTAFVILVDLYLNIGKFPSMAIHIINITNIAVWSSSTIIRQNRQEKAVPMMAWKQINTLQGFLIFPTVIYLLASVAIASDAELTLTEGRVLLYAFPVVMIVSLAWGKVIVAAHRKLRKDYPQAFIA
jgi:hypothetical protein